MPKQIRGEVAFDELLMTPIMHFVPGSVASSRNTVIVALRQISNISNRPRRTSSAKSSRRQLCDVSARSESVGAASGGLLREQMSILGLQLGAHQVRNPRPLSEISRCIRSYRSVETLIWTLLGALDINHLSSLPGCHKLRTSGPMLCQLGPHFH